MTKFLPDEIIEALNNEAFLLQKLCPSGGSGRQNFHLIYEADGGTFTLVIKHPDFKVQFSIRKPRTRRSA